MKTMTLDEIRNLPPLTEEERQIIRNAKPIPSEDCPEMTESELNEFQSVRVSHPEWFLPKNSDVRIKIDADVLEAFKAKGRGYQTRINAVLRQAVASGKY